MKGKLPKTIARRIFDRSGGYGMNQKYTNEADETPVKHWGNGSESRLTYKDGSVLVKANPRSFLVSYWD